MVDKLRGCDQETLDEVTQTAGVSIPEIEASGDQLCDEMCDVQSLASCNKPGHGVETFCG